MTLLFGDGGEDLRRVGDGLGVGGGITTLFGGGKGGGDEALRRVGDGF